VGKKKPDSHSVKWPAFTKGGSMSQIMPLESAVDVSVPLNPESLTQFQVEVISLFISAAIALSLPKSLGEIYGLFFSTEEPLAFEDVVEKLQISRGSASEGIRRLRAVGALIPIDVPGHRREHFTAETSLRKLATGYLQDRIYPQLESGEQRLRDLDASINDSSSQAAFQRHRAGQISSWQRFFQKTLPLVNVFASKF
jgi:DNA-binding transcriptional regulator GbsR (MarR family)